MPPGIRKAFSEEGSTDREHDASLMVLFHQRCGLSKSSKNLNRDVKDCPWSKHRMYDVPDVF